MMGKTPSSRSGMKGSTVSPGRDFRIFSIVAHSAGISSANFPKKPAILRPAILPEKIAAEASAISLESPAEKTGKPTRSACPVNSLTGSRPTAIRTVSHSYCLSVPGIGLKFLSTWAMTTFSTCSSPRASMTVWDVKTGTPERTSLSLCTLYPPHSGAASTKPQT